MIVLDDVLLNAAIRSTLRGDAALSTLVGVDPNGEVKVFRRTAPPDSELPYITWHRIGGGIPEGTYDDDQCIVPISFDTACWGRGGDEAWQMNTTVGEVVRDIESFAGLTDPWYLMTRPRTMGDAIELEDRDTRAVYVVTTWQFMLSHD